MHICRLAITVLEQLTTAKHDIR